MKKIIAVAVALVLSSSIAQAEYVCQPTYYPQYDPNINGYVTIRGVDRCQYYPDPPQYYQPPAYYPPPGEYYEGDGDAVSALIGGALGFGLGYVVGNNNNGHNHKNYYYYNGGHNNYYNGNNNNYKRYKYPGGWNNGQGRVKPRKHKNN